MSETRLDSTAGENNLAVETIKSDNVDEAIVQLAGPECVDVTSENATASIKETGAPTETKCSEGTSSGNILDEATNPNTCVVHPKITDETAEIVNTIAKGASALQIDTQIPAASIDNPITIVLQAEEASQNIVTEEEADESMQNAKSNEATYISRLEAELRVRNFLEDMEYSGRNESSDESDNEKTTEECDMYRKKLEDTETKLAVLQASYNTIRDQGSDENMLQQSIEQLHGQLARGMLMCEEKNRVVTNQENQINALNNQVSSLKEVISITRDLLQIRNMEVKQLQAQVDNMEKKISEERDRHNTIINKMDTAMRLNADLKKEYEIQLSLFQSLREKYGEKITLLTGEKQSLDLNLPTSE